MVAEYSFPLTPFWFVIKCCKLRYLKLHIFILYVFLKQWSFFFGNIVAWFGFEPKIHAITIKEMFLFFHHFWMILTHLLCFKISFIRRDLNELLYFAQID